MALFWYGAPASGQVDDSQGFALLDQRSELNVIEGQWLRWVYPPVPSHLQASSPPGGASRGSIGPAVITYQIDEQFMANQDPAVKTAAEDAVIRALDSWSDASNGFVSFERALWDTVPNEDDTFHAFFPGPSQDWWCENFCPTCENCPGGTDPVPSPLDLFPGWGADIDVFSRGSNFSLVSNGITYQLSPTILGFAAVHRSSGSIWSVDIYINHDFTWTTDAGSATSFNNRGVSMCGCGRGPGAHAGARLSSPSPSRGATYDLETVMVHELGHALGLDHPNESCGANGAMLSPWTHEFIACSAWSQTQVMHGSYSGVKRTLSNSEIGGLSFLYRPPLLGDLDGDGRISVRDVLGAFQLIDEPPLVSPYDVSILDFVERNGRIDMVEASQLMLWLLDPINNPPGVVNAATAANGTASASMTVAVTARPTDVGLASTVELVVAIDNPDQIPIQAFEIRLVHDSPMFSGVELLPGTILPNAEFFPVDDGDPGCRIAKIGLSPDASSSGILAIVQLDVDLWQAISDPSSLQYMMPLVSLIVSSNPSPHEFGEVPGESLVIVNGSSLVYHYDADSNGMINIDDWYAFEVQPQDVNKDGAVDGVDRILHQRGLRRGEIPDIESPAK